MEDQTYLLNSAHRASRQRGKRRPGDEDGGIPGHALENLLRRAIIEEAESAGQLAPDSIILECSSGNSGIALAMVGAAKGYKVRILMSATASVERRYLMHQFGAEVEFPEAVNGYATGIEMTRRQAAADSRIFPPRQSENPLNALAHEETTAPEILHQIPGGRVDAFVSGYGTGGTLTGCSRGLRHA